MLSKIAITDVDSEVRILAKTKTDMIHTAEQAKKNDAENIAINSQCEITHKYKLACEIECCRLSVKKELESGLTINDCINSLCK